MDRQRLIELLEEFRHHGSPEDILDYVTRHQEPIRGSLSTQRNQQRIEDKGDTFVDNTIYPSLGFEADKTLEFVHSKQKRNRINKKT